MLDLAKLGCEPPKRVGPVAMKLITVLQEFRRETQAAAIAIAFLLLCRKMEVHPGDLLGHAQNVLNSNLTHANEIRAVRDYINNEIRETR